MAYGMIDDTYLKQVANTVRDHAGVTGTVGLAKVEVSNPYHPDGYEILSKADYYIEDYICKIPSELHISALSTLKIGIGGTAASYSGKSFRIAYVTVTTTGYCTRHYEIKTVDDIINGTKASDGYTIVAEKVLPGTMVVIIPQNSAKLNSDSTGLDGFEQSLSPYIASFFTAQGDNRLMLTFQS